MEEKKLIRLATAGDAQATEELIRHYYPFLYKYLVKLSMNSTNAEDYAQETIVRIIRNLDRYNFKSSFSTWMITIATRIYLDDQRKKKSTMNLMNKMLSETVVETNYETGFETSEQIQEILHRLPDDQRIPIVLFYFYQYKYKEISKILRIPEGTIKTRIYYG
jgi:RNA polymerase sigma-70 factor (ECF subfamily)